MTETRSPADELRAAASRLRELAERATHENRTAWSTGNTLGSKIPVVVDDPEQPSVLIETYAARLEAVNRYVAAMDPALGLALAAWLDQAAEDAEQIGADPHAIAVARSILGDDR